MIDVTSYPCLSGYSYACLADQAIPDPSDTKYMKDMCGQFDPTRVKDGDLIYVSGVYASSFMVNVAPCIDAKFSVVTAQYDPGVNDNLANLLPINVENWWTINAHSTHPKVRPIPLGLQNRNWRWDGNLQSEPSTMLDRRSVPKTKNVMCSFSVGNNSGERLKCIQFAEQRFDELTKRTIGPNDRRNEKFVYEYFDIASEHKMILCPHGAGADTHRMWESLYMGCIPITTRCSAFRDFEDYPIIFLDSWEDLLDVDIDNMYNDCLNRFQTEQRIYFDYWKSEFCK